MKTPWSLVLGLLFIFSCSTEQQADVALRNTRIIDADAEDNPDPFIYILGIAQDAGIPQLACTKLCCKERRHEKVSSIGIVDPKNESSYLLDATPDLVPQWKALDSLSGEPSSVEAIFLTHAHIGHYTGLMYLGKEALGADQLSVFAMPRMKKFLENNGPWSQLVQEKNIAIKPMDTAKTILLSRQLKLQPIRVPHRDEYSETVGFFIEGPSKSALFIPDIDKWGRWDQDIIAWIKKVDYAILDATFYDGEELNNRDMSEIPHPFLVESMALFNVLDEKERNKVYFTHFNHTNPVLTQAEIKKEVERKGYRIAEEGMVLPL